VDRYAGEGQRWGQTSARVLIIDSTIPVPVNYNALFDNGTDITRTRFLLFAGTVI